MQTNRKLIAANWKMNGLRAEAEALARAVVSGAADISAEIVLCTPFTALSNVGACLSESNIGLGAQDCHPEPKGAFTGDVSAEMLNDLGVRYTIVGHSERRALHGETSAIVCAKAAAALRAGMIPIICVGETLAVRESGHAEKIVSRELEESLPELDHGQKIVIAYEPIWAIGAGRSGRPSDIAAMHIVLRQTLARKMEWLAETRILYGASVNRDNAAEILSLPNVDGALVGGASLKAEEFLAIATAASAKFPVDKAPERVT